MAADVPGIQLPLGENSRILFEGTLRLTGEVERRVFPKLPRPPFTTCQEEAVVGVMMRMIAWMQSMSKLNNPGDVQAACAGARSLLELHMDMEILKRDPQMAEKWKAYFFARRYEAAKQLVKLSERHSALKTDAVVNTAKSFVDEPSNKAAVDAASRQHWGGSIPKHWSGWVSFIGVAEHLGSQYERLYRVAYYKLSDHLHPGPGGPLYVDEREIAGIYDYAHLWAQDFFGRSVMDGASILGLMQDGSEDKRAIEEAMYWAAEQIMAWKGAIQREADRLNKSRQSDQ